MTDLQRPTGASEWATVFEICGAHAGSEEYAEHRRGSPAAACGVFAQQREHRIALEDYGKAGLASEVFDEGAAVEFGDVRREEDVAGAPIEEARDRRDNHVGLEIRFIDCGGDHSGEARDWTRIAEFGGGKEPYMRLRDGVDDETDLDLRAPDIGYEERAHGAACFCRKSASAMRNSAW